MHHPEDEIGLRGWPGCRFYVQSGDAHVYLGPVSTLARWSASVHHRLDRLWQVILAHGFRLTGQPIFIDAFHSRRDILLSPRELGAVAASIRSRPGSMLVFGAGHDSALWTLLNRGHPTVILESEAYWIRLTSRRWKNVNLQHVLYTTRLFDCENMEKEVPGLDLPPEIRRQRWQTILVDAPQGWGDGPGRSQSIFEASRLAAEGARIFVHDCDRIAERKLASHFLARFKCVKITEKLWLFH